MTKVRKIYYTSDLHIGHRLVSKIRGFFDSESGEPNVRSHDFFLAQKWDSLVNPEDKVYVLGDISINGGQYALDWIEQRPGEKVLISGNHDPVHPYHRKAEKLFPHWSLYFSSIQPFLVKRLAGRHVLLSHFPYSGTGAEGHGHEERSTQYRMPDLGLPLLHGHTHGPERHHVSDQGSIQLHVGLDAWGLDLVPQEAVLDWLDGNPRK